MIGIIKITCDGMTIVVEPLIDSMIETSQTDVICSEGKVRMLSAVDIVALIAVVKAVVLSIIINYCFLLIPTYLYFGLEF